LSRAVTASNRKKWSFSFWFKKTTNSQTDHYILDSSAWTTLTFNNNALGLYDAGAGAYLRLSAQVFRDPSAWYYILVVYDSDNATAQNRLRFYCNGVEIATWQTNTTITPGFETRINGTYTHTIGTALGYPAGNINGYLADIHFIDGQALDPTSFGEFDATTGVWVPKAYTGSYGTNGFHLEFADNSSNTATTLGKDTSGNSPANNWTPNNLSTTTGGPTSVASASGALPIYNTTDTYGTTKGTGTRTDSNSSSIVLAIPMDGTNNGTTFTDESATIKGSGSAKTISRFGDTKTSTAQSKFYGSSGFFDGTEDYLQAPAGTDFSYGTGDFTFEAWIYPTTSGTDRIIYAQTTSGNNYVNAALTTSNTFSVQINASGAGNNVTSTGTVTANVWTHIAVTRQSTVVKLFINGVQDGSGTRNVDLQISSTVPTIGTFSHTSTLNFAGYIQDFRIYKGVAKYTANFNPPSSTQNPSIAAGNDSLVDVPSSSGTDTGVGGEVRGNYCTWNAVAGSGALANGNLDFSSSGNPHKRIGTIGVASSKWYFEAVCTTQASSFQSIGVGKGTFISDAGGVGGVSSSWGVLCETGLGNGYLYHNSSNAAGDIGTINVNDVMMFALDVDAGKFWVGLNGTWYNSGSPSGGTNATWTGVTGELFPVISSGSGGAMFANFGQRPFAYTAPSGFKALNTTNLPAPLVTKPNTVMDVLTWTGTGGSRTFSGLNFSPDLIWGKGRSQAYNHQIYDIIRDTGASKVLMSNSTAAEGGANAALYGYVSGFNSNGFATTAGTTDNSYWNELNTTYVAWAWDAGSSTVTNTQGSITSSVRANATAGFSIVTYTANGTNGTSVGHGLGVKPALVIQKDRTSASDWLVLTQLIDGSNDYLLLNSTAAAATAAAGMTSTTFGSWDRTNGNSMVAYCFAPVVGYSAMGSFSGGSGIFTYTGFRPKWLLIKQSSAVSSWIIYDTSRDTYNVMGNSLYPNLSDAEISSPPRIDFVSNGFVTRAASGSEPSWTGTVIYFAVAESPFNYARAR
jgi:hypothetical protein